MSVARIGLGPEHDEDVSPLRAQNDGPARVGPATGSLPQKKTNEADRRIELERGRLPKGGDASLRDDA